MDDDLLAVLKRRFLSAGESDAFYAFAYQLARECLILPLDLSFEENGDFLSSLEGGRADMDRLNGAALSRDGYILAYTCESEIPEDHPFSLVYLEIEELERAMGEMLGYIVDPDTEPLVLDRGIIEQLASMKREGKV